MKRKFISFLSLTVACTLCLGTVSCGDDDDDDVPQPKNNTENQGGNTENQGGNTENQGGEETPVSNKFKVTINGTETEVEKDAKVTLPEIAEYSFADVELVDDKGNKYTSKQEITITENITITTSYTLKPVTLSVTGLGKKLAEIQKGIKELGVKDAIDITLTDYVDDVRECQSGVNSAIQDYGEFPMNLAIAANENFTTLNENSLSRFPELRKLVLPEGVTYISRSAISNNDKLSEIVLPNSLTDIEIQAFYGNKSLESLSIGENLKNLGGGVIIDCPKLTTITIRSIMPATYYSWFTTSFDAYDWDNNTYVKNTTLQHIYVLAEHLDWYKENYPDYVDIIEAIK